MERIKTRCDRRALGSDGPHSIRAGHVIFDVTCRIR